MALSKKDKKMIIKMYATLFEFIFAVGTKNVSKMEECTHSYTEFVKDELLPWSEEQ